MRQDPVIQTAVKELHPKVTDLQVQDLLKAEVLQVIDLQDPVPVLDRTDHQLRVVAGLLAHTDLLPVRVDLQARAAVDLRVPVADLQEVQDHHPADQDKQKLKW